MGITKHIRGVMRRLDTRRAKAVLMSAVLALSTLLNAVSPMAAYAAETTAAPDTITVTGYNAFSNSSGMWNSHVQAHYATDENGNETPGTIEDAELFVTADNVHTFHEWKRRGQSVKLGETHVIECYLWQFTTKPSKAQREAAEAEGKEAAEHPHFYPTKAHLFSCLQVESNNPAPAGRFKSMDEIKAYNAKLAAERKAAKAAKAAAPAPAKTSKPATEPEPIQEAPAPVVQQLDFASIAAGLLA